MSHVADQWHAAQWLSRVAARQRIERPRGVRCHPPPSTCRDVHERGKPLPPPSALLAGTGVAEGSPDHRRLQELWLLRFLLRRLLVLPPGSVPEAGRPAGG